MSTIYTHKLATFSGSVQLFTPFDLLDSGPEGTVIVVQYITAFLAAEPIEALGGNAWKYMSVVYHDQDPRGVNMAQDILVPNVGLGNVQPVVAWSGKLCLEGHGKLTVEIRGAESPDDSLAGNVHVSGWILVPR